jgi:glycosyltransferase involved in cell wall biosynthesis
VDDRVTARAGGLRVLVVADVSIAPVRGGGERVLRESAVRLADRGHRVTVVSRAADGGADDPGLRALRRRDFSVDGRSWIAFARTAMLNARRAALDALAGEGADVLHVHQPLAGYGVLVARAARGLPSLYTFHSPAPLEYRMRAGMTPRHRAGVAGWLGAAVLRWLERACLRRATRVHVLSSYSGTLVERLYGVPAARIVRIAGGVDVERFRPASDRAAIRRGLGLPPDAPVLLTVRNLENRMGLDALLEAFATIAREVPNACLLIGGEGSRRAELEGGARTLRITDRVRFLGFVPDEALPRHYQAADFFVLPTRALEGFGLVTIEALACGTPVLGTPVGATPEILAPLDPSLLFEDESAGAIAAGLRRHLMRRDAEAAVRLRAACRRFAESYGWDPAITALERALGDVSGAGPGPRAARAPSGRERP